MPSCPSAKVKVLGVLIDRRPAGGPTCGTTRSMMMLVTDANQLRQFFTAVGAYSHPNGPPAQPPPVSACATGTAVTDTGTNPGPRLRIAAGKEGRAIEQDHAGLGEDVVQAGAEVDLRHDVSRRSIPHTLPIPPLSCQAVATSISYSDVASRLDSMRHRGSLTFTGPA